MRIPIKTSHTGKSQPLAPFLIFFPRRIIFVLIPSYISFNIPIHSLYKLIQKTNHLCSWPQVISTKSKKTQPLALWGGECMPKTLMLPTARSGTDKLIFKVWMGNSRGKRVRKPYRSHILQSQEGSKISFSVNKMKT